MWRQILVSFVLMSVIAACSSVVTCDPSAVNSNCPNSFPVCDPTGICRQNCQTDGDCKQPGTICDTSTNAFHICQESCNPTEGESCQNGQLCYGYSIPPTTSGGSSTLKFMCKRICPNFSQTDITPPWCKLPSQCLSAGSGSSDSICIGPPK